MEKINVPYGYSYCLADAACPLHDKCLRSKILQQIKDDPKSPESLQTINPFGPSTHYATEQCTQFRSAEKLRYAQGMMGLYHNVPPYMRTFVRGKVIASFSSRRTYYNCRLGQHLLSPKQQRAVAKAFKSCGLDVEPVFDKYVEDYNWN